MRWQRLASILIVCLVAPALPARALAISIAPPGKAGADQYFETLPTSVGNVAPPQAGGKNGLGALRGQSRTGAARLARLGTDGQAAAALAAAMMTTEARGTNDLPRTAERGLAAPSASTSAALSHLLAGSDSGGLGLVLPLLLTTAVLIAIGIAAGRLRRGSDPPDVAA